MMFVAQLLLVLLSPPVLASPLQVDVNVHVDIPDLTGKGTPIRQLATSTSTSTALPTVGLGYEDHQASPSDEDQTYYAFENIPYAKPPVGDRRFKAAEAYSPDETRDPTPLNNGSRSVVCPQSGVGWFKHANDFSQQLFDPRKILDQKFARPHLPKDYPSMPDPIPNQSEDCLTLDVFVPKRIFDNTQADLIPVIVSFHGGGFIFGSKTVFGSPAGILKTAGERGEKGDLIVVSVNYRLGAFGWLGGTEFREAGGFENAGLSDQKAALEWVSNFIQVFGGDPYAITALGESAGASSILHHLTALGLGRQYDPVPKFQKAILQSPAFFPNTSPRKMNDTYHAFLQAAKVNNFEGLQKADTEVLIKANAETVYHSPYGTFTYGPVVSEEQKSFVSVPPTLKMLIGRWFSGVKIMIANNRREGALFTPPWIRNEPDLAAYIKSIYPAMTSDSFEEFAKFYPVPQKIPGTIFDTNEKTRFLYAAAAFGDLGVDCNAWMFNLTNKRDHLNNYRYSYELYPGFHGQDVGSTWYPEAGKDLTEPTVNPQSQAERLQRYITCFAREEDGNPNCNRKSGDVEFKTMSDGILVIGTGEPVLNKTTLEQIPDEKHVFDSKPADLPSEDICNFWANAPYWEEDPKTADARALLVQNGQANEL